MYFIYNKFFYVIHKIKYSNILFIFITYNNINIRYKIYKKYIYNYDYIL